MWVPLVFLLSSFLYIYIVLKLRDGTLEASISQINKIPTMHLATMSVKSP